MNIYIETVMEREVWGNFICNLRFSSDSKILYSKNIDYHNMIRSGSAKKFSTEILEFSSVILYEIDRSKGIYNIVFIDFLNLQVKKHLASNELFEKLSILGDKDKFKLINDQFQSSNFEIEAIKLPIFKSWKKELLFTIHL
jgi:hypothetical protein